MARRPARGIAVTLAALFALTPTIAACGRQADSVAVDANLDGRAVLASAEKTAGASTGTVHLTVTTEVSGMPTGTAPSARPAPSTSFTITGDGAYDRAAGVSSMTIDTGSMFDQVLSSLPAAERDKLGRGLGGTDLTQQIVQQGPVTYLRSGALSALDPSLADKWLKVDASRLGGAAPSGGPLGGISGLGGTGDPSAYLDYLKGAGADVTTVGREQVGGVDTTHLRATLSMRQALESSGVDRAALERSLGQLPGNTASALEELTFPVDVYLDGQGFVRRIRITYDMGGLIQALGSASVGKGSTKGSIPADAGMKTALTVDYADLGAPVNIVVPSPDQTIDVCQAAAKLAPRSSPTSSLPSGLC